MNKKENLKVAVIDACVNGTMTVKVAADRLNFSERYVKKLKARYKKYGASSMLHGNCGKQPKHTISAEIKSKIIEIWESPELEECNFTHFQEILEEDYQIKISYAPLYNFLRSKGYKSPRKHKRPRNHNRRNDKDSPGELLQVDGTPHQFFFGDDNEYCLHGFIDDATHQVTGLYMCENECMHGYLEVTRQTFRNFGVPLALYADGITTLEEANKFLITYIPKFNKKFAIEPKSKKSSFMELPQYVNLDYLLSVKYTRVVDASNSVSISGTTFVIDTKEILHKKKIEICISKRIGLKARFNDKWYKIIPLINKQNKSLKSNDSVEAIIQQFIYFNCLKNERLSA